MIKYIIILILLFGNAIAENKIVNKNWLSFYYGNVSLNGKTILPTGSIQATPEKSYTFNAIELTNSFWITPAAIKEYATFKISLNSYKYINYHNLYEYINYADIVQNKEEDTEIKQGMDVSDFNMNIYFNKNNVLTMGIIDSTRGRTSEYISGIQSNSPLVPQLASGAIEGLFFSHYTDNSDFKLGIHKEGLLELFKDKNRNKQGIRLSTNGSTYYFASLEYKINKDLVILFNGAYSDLSEFSIYDESKTLIPSGEKIFDLGSATGFACNLTYHSDYGTFYTTILKNSVNFDSTTVSPTGQKLEIGDIYLGKSKNINYGFLFGYNNIYDSSLFNREIHYGFEYFKTSDNWYSYDTDKFLNNYGIDQGGEDISYYARLVATKNLLIGLNYSINKSNGTNKLISAEKNDMPRTQKTGYLQITYIF